jgi:hypothetical protein
MKAFNTEDFSIHIPEAFTRENIRGHDTEFWQFKAQDTILSVEYGRLASSVYFRDERCLKRTDSTMEIDGRNVRSVTCSFNDSPLIVVATEFEAAPQSGKLLVIEVRGTSGIEQTATEIVKSVKFHKL